jgi:hypothetical protein
VGVQLSAILVVLFALGAWSIAPPLPSAVGGLESAVPNCSASCPVKLVFDATGWISPADDFCVTVVHVGSVCAHPPSHPTFWVAPDTSHRWSEVATGSVYSPLNGTPYEGSIASGGNGAVQTVVFGSVHPIQHVVIVFLENANPAEVEQSGPYEDYLASTYSGATNFYAACHQSSPNYHAVLSGDTDSCNTTFASDEQNAGCSACHDGVPYQNYTVADLLNNTTSGWNGRTETNLTWADFAENLPPVLFDEHSTTSGGLTTDWYTNGLCNGSTFPVYDGGNQGNSSIYDVFADRHVPLLSEADTLRPNLEEVAGSVTARSQSPACFEHIRSLEPYGPDGATLGDDYGVPCAVPSPMAPGSACTSPPPSFNTTVATGTMLNFSFISPNMCDDGHSVCRPCTTPVSGGGSDCTLGSGSGATWQNASCGTCTNTSANDTIPAADHWLKGFLGALINCTGPYASGSAHGNCRSEMNHTAFFVLYDESEGPSPSKYGGFVWGDKNGELASNVFGPRGIGNGDNNTHFCSTSTAVSDHHDTVCGGPIWETTVVPNPAYGHDGVPFVGNATDVSVLTTVEWLFGLTPYSGEVGVQSGILAVNGLPVFGVCDPSEGAHAAIPPHDSCSDGLWYDYPSSPDTYAPMFSDFSFTNNDYCMPGYCQNWGT